MATSHEPEPMKHGESIFGHGNYVQQNPSIVAPMQKKESGRKRTRSVKPDEDEKYPLSVPQIIPGRQF